MTTTPAPPGQEDVREQHAFDAVAEQPHEGRHAYALGYLLSAVELQPLETIQAIGRGIERGLKA